MIEKLAKKLKAILDANTLLAATYLFEKEDYKETPFATITPSANESNYHSTSENERVYAFLIRVFVERKGQSNADSCESTMRALADSVLNNLDSNWRLPGLETQTGYTFLYMEAAPSRWGYVGGRENECRVAEIEVRCHFSVDVNLI